MNPILAKIITDDEEAVLNNSSTPAEVLHKFIDNPKKRLKAAAIKNIIKYGKI